MSSAYNPIPLQVQAPAPSSLLSSVGAFQNIRDQISQIALRHAQTEQANQQAREYQVQAAQRNRDLSDQNTIQDIEGDPDSYAKITSGDLSPVAGKVQDSTLQKLKASVNTALQSEATRSTEDLARRGTAHTNIGTSLASLQQLRAPDGSLDLARVNESLPGVLQGLAPELKILGVDASKIPDSIADEDHLKLLSSRLGAAAALTAAAQKLKDEQAGTAQKTAQAASEQATANKAIQERDNLIAGKPKIEADAALAKFNSDFAAAHGGLTPDQLATTSEIARHNKKEESVQGGELALKQKTFDATLGSGLDANGQLLSPEALKAAALQDPTANAIAHYQIAPPTATLRNGAPNPELRKVLAINPNYKPGEFAARSKVASDFSAAGSSGKMITAADTGLAHLDNIAKAGEALDNGDIQLLNRIANAVGAQTGSSPKIVYDQIVKMVAPEVSKAVIGAAGGEGERQDMAHSFSSDVNQKTRAATIAATVGLLSQRLHKQAQAYESSMEVPLDLTKRLSPESQAVMAKYTGVAQSIPHVTTKAQFDALPSGAIFTEDDGKQYKKP